jgi:hypothetical protein
MTEILVTNQGHTYGYKAFYKGREIELFFIFYLTN